MNKTVDSSEILQTFSDGLYDALLSALSPVVGGVEYLRRMRQEYRIRKEIQSLKRKRQKFVLTLAGMLSEEIIGEEYDKIGEKLKRIQENSLFMEDFEKLNNLFGSLDRQDQINIMIETAKTTLKFISTMRDEISTNLIGSSDPEHMLVLGQALKCGEQMVNDIILSMKKKPPDIQNTEFCVNVLLVLLTKLLAISMEKMEIESLYSDIAFCIYHTLPQIEVSIDDAAFAILGENE